MKYGALICVINLVTPIPGYSHNLRLCCRYGVPRPLRTHRGRPPCLVWQRVQRRNQRVRRQSSPVLHQVRGCDQN